MKLTNLQQAEKDKRIAYIFRKMAIQAVQMDKQNKLTKPTEKSNIPTWQT